jgi:hypothetical protein
MRLQGEQREMTNDEQTDRDRNAPAGGTDVRRFIASDWLLLDVPHDSPVNLLDQWMKHLGAVPSPWQMIVGLHFPLDDRARGMRVLRPHQAPNVESLRSMALSLVGAKYRVQARLAQREKLPEVIDREPDLARLLNDDRIEIWPAACEQLLPVVLAGHNGVYLSEGSRDDVFDIFCVDPGRAEVFATADEAEAWAEIYLPRHRLTPVYLVVAQARFEQQRAAQVDEGGGSSPGDRARPPWR